MSKGNKNKDPYLLFIGNIVKINDMGICRYFFCILMVMDFKWLNFIIKANYIISKC